MTVFVLSFINQDGICEEHEFEHHHDAYIALDQITADDLNGEVFLRTY